MRNLKSFLKDLTLKEAWQRRTRRDQKRKK